MCLLASLTFTDMRSAHIPSVSPFFTAAASSCAAHGNMSETKYSANFNQIDVQEDAEFMCVVLYKQKPKY